MKRMTRTFNALVLFVALFTGSTSLWAQGTAFTYQGRLNTSNGPATGLYDFQFTVKDAASGGGSVGVFPLSATLPVTNGLFTVTLDQGAGVFTGPNRWLEIAVRTNGAPSYTNLSPRQLITSTPYAVRSANAAIASGVTPGSITSASLAPGAIFALSNPSGSVSNALQVGTGGTVGIGTNAPQAGLHIVSGSNILAPRVLWEQRGETGGYTNLSGANSIAVFGNLLAVGAQGNDDGVTLLDVSDPQAPVLLSQFRNGDGTFTNLSSVNVVALKSNLLVVGTLTSNALTFVSITNPANPVKLAELTDGVGGWNELSGTYGLAFNGNIMAIAAANDGAVTLADISNPAAPIKKVEMKDGVFGFNSLSGAVAVAISGNLLAIGAFYDNAVTLVDITDPTNPIKLSEIRDDVGGFNNLSNVYKVAFSTNGLLAISGASDNAVTIVSVTNPTNPVKLAEIIDGSNGVHSLFVPTGVAFQGNRLAAVGAGSGGGAVTLFDVSNPSSPRTLAVMQDGVGGFDYLGSALYTLFVGTNLAVPSSSDNAITLIGFGTASVGLVTQERVGIGTTQPRAALEVNGDVIVDNSSLFDVNAYRIELGIGSTANTTNSVAIGYNALSTGDASISIGYYTKSEGQHSVAMGEFSTAKGEASFAAGNNSMAEGDFSTAFGRDTIARGQYSLAVGNQSVASGDASVALGSFTKAGGNFSVALGNSTSATNNSMAAGRFANANHEGTFVWADSTFGNFDSTADYQFLVRAAGGVGINTNSGGGFTLNVRGNANVNGTMAATNFSGRFTGNGGGLTNVPGLTAANYLFTYDTTTQQVVSANTFQDITFNTDAQISGWTHTLGTAGFSSAQAGLYLVQYTAHAEVTNIASTTLTLRGTLNNIEVNGSQANVDTDTANQVLPVTKSFIVSANAGQVLRLQFTAGSATDRIVANNGLGTVRPSISMTVIRIQ